MPRALSRLVPPLLALALSACVSPQGGAPASHPPTGASNDPLLLPSPQSPKPSEGAPLGSLPTAREPLGPHDLPSPPLALPEVLVLGQGLDLPALRPEPSLRFRAPGATQAQALPWPPSTWQAPGPGAALVRTQGTADQSPRRATVAVVAPDLPAALWSQVPSRNRFEEPSLAPLLGEVPRGQLRVDLVEAQDLGRLNEAAQAFLSARRVEAGGPWLVLWVGDAGSRENWVVVCQRRALGPGQWHLDLVLVSDSGDGQEDPSAIWPLSRYFVLGLPASFAGQRVASFTLLRERDLLP